VTTALLSVETVLLVLLVVLVAGLLRSHAEVLRRLGPAGEDRGEQLPSPPSTARSSDHVRPAALSGSTPDGDPLTLAFDGVGSRPTLLAFLTSGCGSCAGFWETLGEQRLPAPVQTVIVTHGAERERPARLRSLAPDGVPVVMTSKAWSDYGVPGSPYFVLVDGVIRGEGVAGTWQALASLVGDAIDEQHEVARDDATLGRSGQVEETLAAGGIGPEHPSLYPG
jgi:hypothetical protein